jgi:hypothetical protein
MKRALTARELLDWEVFNSVEPIGDVRGDVQAAIIAQQIVAVNMRKGRRPPKLSKWMPFLAQDQESPRSRILRNFKSYAHSHRSNRN